MRASLSIKKENDGFQVIDLEHHYNFFEGLNSYPVITLEPTTHLLVIMGFGLGVHLSHLREKILLRKHLEILIIESDKDLFEQALQMRDFSDILKRPNVHLLVGLKERDLRDELIRFFSKSTRATFYNSTQVIAHPFLSSRHDLYYRFAERIANEALEFSLNVFGNSCADAYVGLENALKNSQAIFNNVNFKVFEGRYKNVPAIICATGPSLLSQIENLKQCAERAIIFCADSALKPLLDHGVRPSFVTAVERDNVVAEFFKTSTEHTKDICLAACPVVVPEVYKTYAGDSVNVFRDYDYFELFADREELFPIGPTCSNLAFAMARRMGCSPIILVGQDLSYDPQTLQSHTSGTIFREREKPNKLEDLLARGFYYIPANNGGQVLTFDYFHHTLKWFEREIAESNVRCINTSLQGALICGTTSKSLKDLLNDELRLERSEVRKDILDVVRKYKEISFQQKATKVATLQTKLCAQKDWLQAMIAENKYWITQLQTNQNSSDTKKLVATFNDAQGYALRLVNEDFEFKVLLRNVVASYIVNAENNLLAKAREMGNGIEFCRYACGHYSRFFEVLNDWSRQILEVISEEIA